MRYETVERKGKQFALVPVRDLESLQQAAEDLEDIIAADAVFAREQEYFPMEFGEKLTEAYHRKENLVPLWREYRGLTQVQLAKKAKITQAYLSDIERGKKPGSVKTLKALAKALNIDLDDLI